MVAPQKETSIKIITEIWTGNCSNMVIRGGVTGGGREIGRSNTITVAEKEAVGEGKRERGSF